MPYVPNAFDSTQPTEDKFVESAAAEFRTAKGPLIRTLRFPAADLETNRGELPGAAARAGRVLGFDAVTGQPVPVAAIGGSTPVTAFGAQLVGTADSGTARSLLNTTGKNKIINGKMEIAGRGTSFSAISSAMYSLDRWAWSPSSAAVITINQNADVPANEFQASLRTTVTTADASIAAGDFAQLGQVIEGFNARDLIGRAFTLSFWVRSAKTGTHCVSLRNSGNDRSYVLEYAVTAANTWEKKTLTVASGLLTAGNWNWGSGVGVSVNFLLACGSTFQTTPNAWQTGNFIGTANQVNCLDTVGNIFAITGVQLEAGAEATAFDHRPHGLELLLTSRYGFPLTSGASGIADLGLGYCQSTITFGLSIRHPVQMRSNALLTFTGGVGDYAVSIAGSNIVCTGITAALFGPDFTFVNFTVAGGLVAGQAGRIYAAGGSRTLFLSSEF